MQYSPKLKNAMEEIKSILNKYDIGASIVLHAPGFSEHYFCITPSYSIIKLESVGLRFKTKGEPHKKVEDTINMITHLSETSLYVGRTLFDLKDRIIATGKIDIEERKGRRSGSDDQNN
jgi:hypothetical protein